MIKRVLPSIRPSNEDELYEISGKAYELAKNNQYEEALLICEWLIAEPFSYIEGLRRRASILSHMRDEERAIIDLETILVNGVEDLYVMFSVVMLYLKFERNIEAELVCDKGIKVSLETDDHYYLNELRMLKAESLLRQQKGIRALEELAKVAEIDSMYFFGRGIRTNEEMVAQARQLIERAQD
jgi:tetratricopeptide (TPR) repeat protein